MAYENELMVCWLKRRLLAKCFLPMTSVSIVSVVAIGEQFVKWRRRVLGDKQHRLLASCTFQQSTAKIANVHQHDEVVLKPLNISVDKKTQEERKDIRLDWYFAMGPMFAIGSWQAWLALRPHVWTWWCAEFCSGKKVIYEDWRQQIKWNYRCTGTKSNQQCAALASLCQHSK